MLRYAWLCYIRWGSWAVNAIAARIRNPGLSTQLPWSAAAESRRDAIASLPPSWASIVIPWKCQALSLTQWNIIMGTERFMRQRGSFNRVRAQKPFLWIFMGSSCRGDLSLLRFISSICFTEFVEPKYFTAHFFLRITWTVETESVCSRCQSWSLLFWNQE